MTLQLRSFHLLTATWKCENSTRSIHGQCPKKVSGVLFSNNWNKVFIFKLVEKLGESIELYRIWSRWINWTMGKQQENTFKGLQETIWFSYVRFPWVIFSPCWLRLKFEKNMTINVVYKIENPNSDVTFHSLMFFWWAWGTFHMEIFHDFECFALWRRWSIQHFAEFSGERWTMHPCIIGLWAWLGLKVLWNTWVFNVFGWFARMCPQLSLFHVGKL